MPNNDFVANAFTETFLRHARPLIDMKGARGYMRLHQSYNQPGPYLHMRDVVIFLQQHALLGVYDWDDKKLRAGGVILLPGNAQIPDAVSLSPADIDPKAALLCFMVYGQRQGAMEGILVAAARKLAENHGRNLKVRDDIKLAAR